MYDWKLGVGKYVRAVRTSSEHYYTIHHTLELGGKEDEETEITETSAQVPLAYLD